MVLSVSDKGKFRFWVREGVVKGEARLEHLTESLYVEAEKLLRIPQFITGLVKVINGVNNIYNKFSNYERSTKLKDPIRGCFLVGSLARYQIGHIYDYERLAANSAEVTQYKIIEITRRHGDFDGCLILSDRFKYKSTIDKNNFITAFKEELPKMSENLEGYFDGYEFHDDCRLFEDDVLNNFRRIKQDPEYIKALSTHEAEIFSKDSDKTVKPVIIYLNQNIEITELNNYFKSYIDGKHLRELEDYIETTWKKYDREFERIFPDKSKEIKDKIKEEYSNSK